MIQPAQSYKFLFTALTIPFWLGFLAAVLGQNGLVSLAGYLHQRTEHLAQLKVLQAERDRLAHHADLLDPRHVDPDFAEETVRRQTGQIRPDEVILPAN